MSPNIHRTKRGTEVDLHLDNDPVLVHDAILPYMPKEQRYLLIKGIKDDKTVVNVSVTIKFSPDYRGMMPVFPRYGLQLVSSYLIHVC